MHYNEVFKSHLFHISNFEKGPHLDTSMQSSLQSCFYRQMFSAKKHPRQKNKLQHGPLFCATKYYAEKYIYIYNWSGFDMTI